MRCRHRHVLLVLALLSAAHAGTVSGRAWLDRNGNGRPDADEPGLAGVAVSDGRTIVRTGADGAYQLALPEPGVVFAVNPPGTWPTGRWWVDLRDAADTRFDVAFRQEAQDGPVLFVHGTDMHVSPRTAELYDRYVAAVNRLPLPPRFVVHTGDLVLDTNLADRAEAKALVDTYQQATSKLTAPVRECRGNHEMSGVAGTRLPKDDPWWGPGMHHANFGPDTYAFRFGRAHFLALDGTDIDNGRITYRLTAASAGWAARYLADVPAGEPIVLLIHEPLGNGPNEPTLLGALQGKTLVATLCGHGHVRSVGTWGGAPQIMGGAVSYAWHGYLPFPPQPWGYVLYRLEGAKLEYLFMDWATERSLDVGAPDVLGVVRGKAPVKGVVDDLRHDLTAVESELAGRKGTCRLSPRGTLGSAFEGELDASGLADGVYEWTLTAVAGDRRVERREPVVVDNGGTEPFTATGPAKLSLTVAGAGPAGAEVLVNGEPVATVTGAKAQVVTVDLPAAKLRRLNRLTVRTSALPTTPAPLAVSRLSLTYGERKLVDVRYAFTFPRNVPGPRGAAGEFVSYVDLTYSGTRGMLP